MAIIWECPKCEKLTGGSASNYGAPCNDCNPRIKEEQDRWNNLPIEQKVEELKKRLDSMQPAIDAAWLNTPIG